MKTILKPGRQKGVAAIELAFVLPLMLILVFGITELGRALYQYNGLVKATRGAVRYLALQDLANADLGVVRQKTQNIAVCGNENCSGLPPLVTGLTTSLVIVCHYANEEAGCEKNPNPYQGVETGQGTVDMASVAIDGFAFKSIVTLVIPDMTFAPIKTTMVARYN
jgi:Flp pilus assembly protein TadG